MVNVKKQFQPSMFNFEHHTVSDFYLSCWQNNHSAVPLLCVRAVILIGIQSIIIASIILTGITNLGYWLIYMTHWGLILNIIAAGLAFMVSLRAYQNKPLEASWHVKVYWAFYDMSVVVAFFITIYYFAFLQFQYEDLELAVNQVLDIFIHGVNSVFMFTLLMTSRHPSRLLHFIYPLGFGIIYLLFSVVYHFAGGTDLLGNYYIYPTLDWGEAPGEAGVTVVISAVALIVIHLIVVGFAACRNWLARRYSGRRSKSMDIS